MKKIIYVLLSLLLSVNLFAQNFSGAKIYINPGHGGYDAGNDRNIVVYPFAAGDSLGFWESKSNLQKGLVLDSLLKKAGAQTIISRTLNRDVDDRNLSEIAEEANANNVDAFISIHSNATTPNNGTNYLLIEYHGTDNNPTVAASLPMAQMAFRHLVDNKLTYWTSYSATNINARGDISFMGGNGLGVLRPLTIPGFLAECAFHDYTPETYRMLNLDYTSLDANRFFNYFAEYFNAGARIKGDIAGCVRGYKEKMDLLGYTNYVRGSSDEWKPLNGATITLKDAGDNVLASKTTDTLYNGVFAFFDLAPGNYKLSYHCEGYRDTTRLIVVAANKINYDLCFLVNLNLPPDVIIDKNDPDPKQDSTVVVRDFYQFREMWSNPAWADKVKISRILQSDNKLYILTKDPKVLVVHPKTGALIKELSLTGIPVEADTDKSIYLKDIALTRDGKLIACNYATQPFVASGGSGNFKVWSWENDDVNPKLYFSTNQVGNWTTGLVGWSLAFFGNLKDGKLYTISKSSTSVSCRVLAYQFTDGVCKSARGQDYTYMDGNTVDVWGNDYRLYTLPEDKQILMVGDKKGLTQKEFTFEKSFGSAMTLVDSLKMAQGESYSLPVGPMALKFFKYAGQRYLAYNLLDTDQKNARLVLLNVTDSLSGAKKISDELIPSSFAGAETGLFSGGVAVHIDNAKMELFAVTPGQGAAAFAYPFKEKEIYKVGTGMENDFQSLKTAVDSINKLNFETDVELLITSNLTEPFHMALGPDTKGYTLTIRPDADQDRTVTFTQTGDNGAPSGAFIIGMKDKQSWTSLTSPKNIVMDGFAENGSTRRLKFSTANNVHRYNGPILLVGNPSNITIKNCIIQHGFNATPSDAGNSFAIGIRNRNQSGIGNFAPHDILIENNEIINQGHTGACGVLYISGGSVKTTGTRIVGNTISARRDGIWSLAVDGTEISGNNIQINQTTAESSYMTAGINLSSEVTGKITIAGNTISQLKSASTNGSYGVVGILLGALNADIKYKVHNNMITGFSLPTGSAKAAGIVAGSESLASSSVCHNTILMNEMPVTTTSIGSYSGVDISSGSPVIENNIVISDEGNLTHRLINGNNIGNSEFNLFYLRKPGNHAFINNNYKTLDEYVTGLSRDIHSVYKDVDFVSATDLHLAGSMDGDSILSARLLPEVPMDIDGDARRYFTYMGADELGTELEGNKQPIVANVITNEFVYDGTPKNLVVECTPGGLPFSIVYKQGEAVVTNPTNAGVYSANITCLGNDYCKPLEMQATLTILKANQSIAWDQTFNEVSQGTNVTLTATSNSSQPVVYSIVSGNELVTLAENNLLFNTQGTIVVEASVPESQNYFAADPVRKTIVVVTTGLPEIAANPVEIAPNPAQDYIQVTLPTAYGNKALLVITDLSGRQVLKEILVSEKTSIPVGILTAGHYVVNIQGNGLKHTSRLIIK